jgi:CRP-like cAMP-binding protein
MSETLIKNINKHIRLEKEEKSYVLRVFREKEVKKKEFILSSGQLCDQFSFVESGSLRAFYMDAAGKESTIMFAFSDWWITDMHCFVNGLPAMLNIVALENSKILQISKADLDHLYIQIPKFERFFRILLQNAYTREQVRVIQNLSLTAEERYDIFLNKYPQVARQVTQKQIASYLGITPEFLSMIRARK